MNRVPVLRRARLPLNIFEPRYLAMLEDTLKTPHRLIGMIQPITVAEAGEAGLRLPTEEEARVAVLSAARQSFQSFCLPPLLNASAANMSLKFRKAQ